MEQPNWKNHRAVLCAALIVLGAIVLRQIGARVDGLLDLFCNVLRSVLYIGLFTAWGISVRRRIIQPQERRYLTAIAGLMVFWITVRTIRYLLVVDPWVLRHLWYLYYLPMLFIPFLAVFVALSLGKPEHFRLPQWTALLYIPAAALVLLVLTNDLHQLVFAFPADAAVWEDDDYRYTVGYFLAVGWQILCALTALVTMLIKCRVPNSRKVFLLPFVPVLLALIYGVLYFFRVPWLKPIAGDMTVVFCLLFAAVLESCIQCGLIQTNTGYGKLFEIGTIGAQITDAAYHTRYASSNGMALSQDVMRAAEQGSVSLDKDTLLKSSRISGGHVLWQEDIADMTALLERLEENRKTIEDSNSLEEENYRTQAKINTLREKNRLYDQLQKQTASQIDLLDGLLNQYEAETDPEITRSLLAKIGVIGAYIKRRGNLIFIEEKAEVTDTAELSACLEESFTSLQFMDVECALAIPAGQTIPVRDAARVYDLFEAAMEAALEDLRSVWLKGRALERAVIFYMEVESETDLSPLAGLADSCVWEDGVWRFTLRVGKAGEAV
ncbi:histidine kinase N-terminal 7TM domain-containing protein [Evtepia sp.]|uniref:histidine kinase N-terminal 7TM domain-containing protein n=1 Tax=Evtepia sp. TaxID=2773933 RepID=UPI003F16E3C1